MICRTVSWFVIPVREEKMPLSLMSPEDALKGHLQQARCHWWCCETVCLCQRGGRTEDLGDPDKLSAPSSCIHSVTTKYASKPSPKWTTTCSCSRSCFHIP